MAFAPIENGCHKTLTVTRLVRRNIADGNIECRNVPILGIDEGIAVERGDFAASGGILLILADQRRQGGLEITPDGRVAIERNSVPVLAFVGIVNRREERTRRRIGRPRP